MLDVMNIIESGVEKLEKLTEWVKCNKLRCLKGIAIVQYILVGCLIYFTHEFNSILPVSSWLVVLVPMTFWLMSIMLFLHTYLKESVDVKILYRVFMRWSLLSGIISSIIIGLFMPSYKMLSPSSEAFYGILVTYGVTFIIVGLCFRHARKIQQWLRN